jgi:hypothetical protein
MSMMKSLWIFWFLKTPSSVKIITLTHTLFFNPSHFPFHPLFLCTSFFNYKKPILWPQRWGTTFWVFHSVSFISLYKNENVRL